jgi:hypothetical protein
MNEDARDLTETRNQQCTLSSHEHNSKFQRVKEAEGREGECVAGPVRPKCPSATRATAKTCRLAKGNGKTP